MRLVGFCKGKKLIGKGVSGILLGRCYMNLKASITCLSFARANLTKTMVPYKLTTEVQGLIVKALTDGCTRTAAFGAAGIGRRTFYDWLNGVPKFKQAVIDAEADARMRIETRLTNLALDGDRFALMYYLQNRYPDDWKDTRNFKVDQTLQLDDKRKAEATDDDIMNILEKEGIDCSMFRSDDNESE